MSKIGEEHFVAKIAQKVIIEKEGTVLIVCHPKSDIWELPGGRLNKGELPQDGLVREVKEELGVDIIPTGLVYIDTYVHRTEGDHLTIVYKAVLKDATQTFELENEEVAEVRWIKKEQLAQQSIWQDNLTALEMFFKIGDK